MGFLPETRTSGWRCVMAIYSLHHAPIGKATQPRPHTAAAHLRYITRRSACTQLLSARMPARSAQARAWIRREEDGDRKNARVGDKVLLALPRELGKGQRAELLRGFAEAVTKGRASWMAAVHDAGADAHNPHCHLFIRDRDPGTGRRVIGMSERGSTERLRELWERHANQALERAGRAERIDRRTLAAQGIDRKPTIHEGLSAREMQSAGRKIRSRPINYRNAPGARSKDRVVDYRRFDAGRSRPAYNRHIRESVADYWAALDADNVVQGWLVEDRARADSMQKVAFRPAILHERQDGGALGKSRPSGIGFRPARLHVSPQPIGSRQGYYPSSDTFARRPGYPAQVHFDKVDQTVPHDVSLKSTALFSRTLHMDKAVKRRQLEKIRDDAEVEKALLGGAFNNAVDRSYREPDKARGKMHDLHQKEGVGSVRDKLENKPGYFGKRHGSILSRDGFKPGAYAKQQDSTDARKELPGLFDAHQAAAQREAAARRALGETSFSQKLEDDRNKAATAPNPDEKERTLDRWKKDRKRERGR